MTQPAQEWAPLEGRDLLVAVRDILLLNPDRHDQGEWVRSAFDGDRDDELRPVDTIRGYAMQPIPASPQEESGVCGTTGCVAGWTGILSAPPGSLVTNGTLYIPTGNPDSPYQQWSLFEWAGAKLNISVEVATYMFAAGRTRAELIRALDELIDEATPS